MEYMNLVPIDKILNPSKDIRMASTPEGDKMLVYVPVNTNIKINVDLSGYDIKIIDLQNKNVCNPNIDIIDGKTIVYMHNFDQDVVIVIKK